MHTFSNHPIGLLPTEENYDPNKPSIAEFYSGRDIFVTGGTGFMGKVLIEKLLRSCGNVNRIFILMREKKQKTIQERIKEMQQQPVGDPRQTSLMFDNAFISRLIFMLLFFSLLAAI